MNGRGAELATTLNAATRYLSQLVTSTALAARCDRGPADTGVVVCRNKN
jgi:hypothetical protein